MKVIGFQTLKDFREAGYTILDDKDLSTFLNKNLEKFDEYTVLVNNPKGIYVNLNDVREYVQSMFQGYQSIFYSDLIITTNNNEVYVDVIALSYLSYVFPCEETRRHYNELLKLRKYFNRPIRCTLI